jgi:hypothetical protein
MREDDAVFCARTLRHAALGAILGGPIMVGLVWLILTQGVLPNVPAPGGLRSLVGIALSAALLIGVWLGATFSCMTQRSESVEERCYGGALGCGVYVIGGALGALAGRHLLNGQFSPVVCYLAGGTTLALALLILAYLSPAARNAISRRITGP